MVVDCLDRQTHTEPCDLVIRLFIQDKYVEIGKCEDRYGMHSAP